MDYRVNKEVGITYCEVCCYLVILYIYIYCIVVEFIILVAVYCLISNLLGMQVGGVLFFVHFWWIVEILGMNYVFGLLWVFFLACMCGIDM